MLPSILVAYTEDPSAKRAAEVAAQLSRAVNARIVLAHVSRPSPASLRNEAFARELAGIERRYTEDLFEDAQSALGVSCETIHSTGRPAEEFVKLTAKPEVSLAVVGMKPRRGAQKLFYVGFAQQVAQHASCSVLVVHFSEESMPPLIAAPNFTPTYVVGIDGSAESLKALNEAVTLAQKTGARLHLVTVLEPLTVPGPFTLPSEIEASLRAAAETWLTDARRLVPSVVPVAAVIRAGIPARELESEAEKVTASLVVVGAKGRGATSRFLFGSAATELVHHSRLPVLVTRLPDKADR